MNEGVLRVLTVRQPWAGAIAHLGKDIENRPQLWAYRGPVLIHAGLYKPGDADWMEADEYQGVPRKDWAAMPLDFGQIIAITEIVDCVDCTATGRALDADGNALGEKTWMIGSTKWWDMSPWYIEDQLGYVLRNTQPLTPTPYTGGLGLRGFRFDEAASWSPWHDQLDVALQEMGYTSRNVRDGDGLVWEWERSAA